MTALITETEVRCLAVAPPRAGKGTHTALIVPQPLAATFVAGPENRSLLELFHPDSITNLADRSPVVLVGASGTGKTTMAASLLACWLQEDPSRKLTLTSAVEFSRALTRAIKSDDMQRFRQLHRECDGLLIDNVHELAGKPVAQDEFLATLDALSSQGRVVVATSSELPLMLSGLLRSLQSRLSAGLSVVLHPPGKEARYLLLKQIAQQAALGIAPELLQPIMDAEDEERTAVELKGILIRWSHQLRLNPTVSSRPNKAVDHILDSSNSPSVSPQEIVKSVCKEVGIAIDQLKGPSRKSSTVRARGLAMFLIRQLTSESYESIGAFFSGRDHTTVMHACKKTEVELSSDVELCRIHDRIRQRFRRSR
jgi:chromosomal replication initiator protein